MIDAASNSYKLGFLDLYADNGVKGARSIEYQRL